MSAPEESLLLNDSFCIAASDGLWRLRARRKGGKTKKQGNNFFQGERPWGFLSVGSKGRKYQAPTGKITPSGFPLRKGARGGTTTSLYVGWEGGGDCPTF